MIQALLSNDNRPDLAHVSVCFPIDNYDCIYKNLKKSGIGNILVQDCFIQELGGDYPSLKRLEKTKINVDELDYLAKRLEGFNDYELAQFQGIVVSRNFSDMVDLINLTFCCQNVTVIRDFKDMAAVGRTHYVNLHGGMMANEFNVADFNEIALTLLSNEEGIITPYGVIYENNMEMERCYDRRSFPAYQYIIYIL